MKKKLAPVLISLGLLTLVGCDNNENTSSANEDVDVNSGDVLVETDAGDITIDNVLDELGIDQLGNMAFQMTIDMLLEDKYASEVDEDEVNAQIDQLIENMGGEDAFQQVLVQQSPGMTVEMYREQMLLNEYSNEFFADEFDIDEEAIQEEVATGAHILVTFAEDEEDSDDAEDTDEETEESRTQDEALELAESLIEELDDGADFAELAVEHSEDPGSGANGGDLGLVTRGQMVAPFEEALFSMDENSVSEEPVLSDFGYHIIQRNDQPDASELAPVRAQVISREAQSRPDDVFQAYSDLLDEYNVEFLHDELREYIEETYFSRDEPVADDAAEEEDVEEYAEEDAVEDADESEEADAEEEAETEDNEEETEDEE